MKLGSQNSEAQSLLYDKHKVPELGAGMSFPPTAMVKKIWTFKMKYII